MQVAELKPTYLGAYDIVLVEDPTWAVPRAIIAALADPPASPASTVN